MIIFRPFDRFNICWYKNIHMCNYKTKNLFKKTYYINLDIVMTLNSSFTIDQLVFYEPNCTLVVSGFVKVPQTFKCQTSTITINLIFSGDITNLILFNSNNVTLALQLICPNEQVDTSIEFDSSQFFTVNADNPFIRQVVPCSTIPANFTIRLPTQKIVKERAISMNYSKCIDYFQCQDFVLTINFPSMTYTSQFNFTLEIPTKSNIDTKLFCKNLSILQNNCGNSCFSFWQFNLVPKPFKILLKNSKLLSCHQKIICFYPYNRIKTDKDWKFVKNISIGDKLLSKTNKLYQVNNIYKLPIYNAIDFIKFPQYSIDGECPINDCYLTPEHMVSTKFGNMNAQQFSDINNFVHKISLYTEHIYSFEVKSTESNIYINYEELPARVWSINEKHELKKELSKYLVK